MFAERGSFHEAAVHLEVTRSLLSRVLGDGHQKTTTAALGLAGVYWGLGRLEEAIALQCSVVEIRTRVLGTMSREALVAMDQLGRSYWLYGQYVEALELQQITSERMKKTLGDKDPVTLAAVDNLGVTLGAWHRYQESLELHQEVLEARTELLGALHLDTIMTKANLAMALLDLGRHGEAKTYMTEVHLQRQKQLGKEHPWTLWELCYLIKINMELDLLDEAEEMAEWGTRAAIRSLHDKHLGVLMGQGCMAQIYVLTGRVEEAQALTLKIIEGLEEARGIAHPDCVFALWKLARISALRGCRDEAIRICERGLESRAAHLQAAPTCKEHRDIARGPPGPRSHARRVDTSRQMDAERATAGRQGAPRPRHFRGLTASRPGCGCRGRLTCLLTRIQEQLCKWPRTCDRCAFFE